jgi:hypothetical protein
VGEDLIELLALELALEGQQAAGSAPWPRPRLHGGVVQPV